jgi:flagella basal body P-ring formation protein FlgA
MSIDLDTHKPAELYRIAVVLVMLLQCSAQAWSSPGDTGPSSTAQLQQASGADPSPEDSLRAFIDVQTAGIPGRVEISVGKLSPRPALAPCARIEPFIPAGTRLWGRAALGLRCQEGARWSVLVPVHIRIFGPALHAVRPLAAGQGLAPGDFEIKEIELTREMPGILTTDEVIAKQVLARPVMPGTALRRDHFRARLVAVAGDQVTLTYTGSGFSVSSIGKLLQPAAEGQTVRVQVESGRIISGVATAARTVEIRQ